MNKQLLKRALVCTLMLSTFFVFAGGGQETGEAAAAQGKEEKVEIVLWDVQTSNILREIVDSSAQRFMEDYPNVVLDVVHIQNDAYKTKLKVAMGAGTPPDIFHNWGGGTLKAYIDSNNVYPITETAEKLKAKNMEASFDPVSFDGTVYGVPYGGLNGVFLWYRKDVLARNNLQPPKTWDELIQVGEALKKNGIIPLALANKTKWTGSMYFMYIADRIGGNQMFANAYAGTGSFEDPGYIRTGQLIQELVRKDFFPKGFNGMDYDTGQSRNLLYTGKAGMMLMGAWILGAAASEAPEVLENIGILPFPAIEGGKGDPSNLIGSPGQNYFSVSQASKNKELATIFLRDYVMSDEWVQFMVENGYVPPVKGAADMISDPLLKEAANYFEAANAVQLYYDQYLPPELGEMHKDVTQALFGLAISPEEAARQHQEALEEYMAEQ
ncbi:extracellular solute-binding protein [Marispirochaeta aestuarii]|uniref:extracellular solute-binding protein n=1 Tax=Marispirochaeta aestuarii TaxID=1963862 RepID=UPI0029C85CD2|nr:extracellular solute-binding protein [Marispirochaeta aestuarii]